jgi:sn-glycerol 3-phosphate transport system substrate-binding protein
MLPGVHVGLYRKSFVVTALILLVTSPIFAKQQPLSFWHILGYHAKPVLDEMIDEYNRAHSEVQVKPDFQGFFEDAQVKMLTAALSRSLPEVAQIPFEFLQIYVDNGLIAPINGEIPEELLNDVQDSLWSLVERDGSIYGLPFCVFTDVFYYNENAFRRAGLDPDRPPESWEEMVEMGKRLTGDSDADGVVDAYALTFYTDGIYGMAPILWANGGQLFTGDGKRINLTSPEMEKTVLMIHDLFFKYRLISRTWTGWESAQAFLTGKLAMGWFISAGIPYGEHNLPWPLRITHMPRFNGKQCGLLSGTVLVNFATKRKPRRASTEFMLWLLSRENDVRFYESIGFVPVRTSSRNSLEVQAYARAHPNYRIPLEAMAYARPLPHHPEFLKINQAISDMLSRIILQGADPLEELQKTEREINGQLD